MRQKQIQHFQYIIKSLLEEWDIWAGMENFLLLREYVGDIPANTGDGIIKSQFQKMKINSVKKKLVYGQVHKMS